jgi:hypothetical protein
VDWFFSYNGKALLPMAGLSGAVHHLNCQPCPIQKTPMTDPNSPGIDLRPASASAVSWGAIVAGAVGAAALSLILLMLGVGLGLSSVSPWVRTGLDGGDVGKSSIAWVILTQLLASGMGGFLAGRLRTRWIGAHSDEVYFRDTAHGFLAWALASLATAAMLTSMISSILGSGVQAAASVAGGVAATATNVPGRGAGPSAYFVDSLFRQSLNATAAVAPVPSADAAAATGEISRIFMNSMPAAKLPDDDLQYVAQVVARRTGLNPTDAQQRVSDTYTRLQSNLTQTQTSAKETANRARRAGAHASLWLFISLLCGAFVASLSATFGGRLRDD